MIEYEVTQKPTLCMVDEIMRQGEPRTAPKQGIFKECSGTISTQYLGGQVQTSDIETAILNEYEYENIGFRTWQEFAGRFRNTWNRYFGIFKQNIENVEDFTVTDAKETVKETISSSQNSSNKGSSDTKYSNTPNQYLQDPNNYNGLTTINEGSFDNLGKQSGSSERNLETDKGGNAFERWLELSSKNRNILYDFIDRFRPLFSTTYNIRRV